jgi:two-component system NtrC family sensor kinase
MKANTKLLNWTRTLEEKVEEKTKTVRQAQTKLIQSEKMASLGALAAIVAHEINNPLSGVLTYTKLVQKMLSKESLPSQKVEEIQQYLGAMAEETARCGEIVKNLLTFARQSKIVVKASDLNKAIERVLFLIRHKLELQSITLSTQLDPGLPQIVCDIDQIQQALLAILINAIEAMPSGGTLDVATHYVSDEQEVQITVSDTGIGIPQDVLPRLFEPFFTTKEGQRGVGLGLSIVFGIIQRHHGMIDVASEVNRGTTVTMTLPERTDVEEESKVES